MRTRKIESIPGMQINITIPNDEANKNRLNAKGGGVTDTNNR